MRAATSGFGTFETCRPATKTSADGGIPEVAASKTETSPSTTVVASMREHGIGIIILSRATVSPVRERAEWQQLSVRSLPVRERRSKQIIGIRIPSHVAVAPPLRELESKLL